MDVTRNYPFSDVELLHHASTVQKGLAQFGNELMEGSSIIDDGFLKQFQDAFNQAHAVPRDDELVQQITELRDKIEKELDVAKNLFVSFKYYIQEAFPHDFRMWDQFSYQNYNRACHDQNHMVHCLDAFMEILNENRSALKTVHCPPRLFSDLESIDDQLRMRAMQLDETITERERLIERRIENFNHLFGLMKTVRAASESDSIQNIQVKNVFQIPLSIKHEDHHV